MKTNTEVYLVVSLDTMMNQIYNVIDELDELDSPIAEKAVKDLINVTMKIDDVIDALVDEGVAVPPSGAV